MLMLPILVPGYWNLKYSVNGLLGQAGEAISCGVLGHWAQENQS